MFRIVPAFLGRLELTSIIDLYLDPNALSAHTNQEEVLDTLMKTMTRKIPGQILLQVLCETTPSVIGEESAQLHLTTVPTIRLFSLFNKASHEASREDVYENLRLLFAQFIQAFDLRSRIPVNIVPVRAQNFSR